MQKTEDYYINAEGYLVFTREYHLKRGYCCKNKCQNCPWDYGKEVKFPAIKNQPKHIT